MIHDVADVPGFVAAMDTDVEESLGLISRPEDVAVLEQMRERTHAHDSSVTRIATDVCIWRPGEGPRREVTKIAGLPYRPADWPWPTTPSGEPLTFVAQFCFADSRDLVPPLPAEILLIFASGSQVTGGVDTQVDLRWGEGLTFEWVRLGDGPLTEAGNIPPSDWRVRPRHAALHRMWDYSNVAPSIAANVPAVTEGTKIGGLCPWLGEEDYVQFGPDATKHVAPGMYLCTLASNSIGENSLLDDLLSPLSYPPNSQERRTALLAQDERRRGQDFAVGDLGLLNIFLNDRGDIRWTGHSQT